MCERGQFHCKICKTWLWYENKWDCVDCEFLRDCPIINSVDYYQDFCKLCSPKETVESK